MRSVLILADSRHPKPETVEAGVEVLRAALFSADRVIVPPWLLAVAAVIHRAAWGAPDRKEPWDEHHLGKIEVYGADEREEPFHQSIDRYGLARGSDPASSPRRHHRDLPAILEGEFVDIILALTSAPDLGDWDQLAPDAQIMTFLTLPDGPGFDDPLGRRARPLDADFKSERRADRESGRSDDEGLGPFVPYGWLLQMAMLDQDPDLYRDDAQ